MREGEGHRASARSDRPGRRPAGLVRIYTVVTSPEDVTNARLMIDGLRAFGGTLADAPVWAFLGVDDVDLKGEGIEGLAIETPPERYPFDLKVEAAGRAEVLAREEGAGTLVWLAGGCLVVGAPELLRLCAPLGAAARPVHIRNVGSPISEPRDPYWDEIYRAVGIDETEFSVRPLIGSGPIRPYFNTHLFSVDPALGILAEWVRLFRALSADHDFQSGPCRDATRRIFLHQAVLSALLAGRLSEDGIRLLPRAYSYPLHLHDDIPPERRARTLDELVCPVYEGVYRHPATLAGLTASGELGGWLSRAARRSSSTGLG